MSCFGPCRVAGIMMEFPDKTRGQSVNSTMATNEMWVVFREDIAGDDG